MNDVYDNAIADKEILLSLFRPGGKVRVLKPPNGREWFDGVVRATSNNAIYVERIGYGGSKFFDWYDLRDGGIELA